VATFYDTEMRGAPDKEIEYQELAATLPAFELIYSAEQKRRDKAKD
jgi:hypothetical protein